jgi:hypothetical protein
LAHFKGQQLDSCCLALKNRLLPKSWQTQQWPQQERDARHQRTEAARHDEKQKIFHAAPPFFAAVTFLQNRRLKAESVPAI